MTLPLKVRSSNSRPDTTSRCWATQSCSAVIISSTPAHPQILKNGWRITVTSTYKTAAGRTRVDKSETEVSCLI